MFGSALGAMRLPQSLVGLDLRRRYSSVQRGLEGGGNAARRVGSRTHLRDLNPQLMSTKSAPPLCRVSAPHLLCLWTTSPGARAFGTLFSSTIGLSTF
jgi:hypothetical protein